MTAPSPEHRGFEVGCAVCGQVDNHPMIHDAVPWTDNKGVRHDMPSWHFDCYPPDLKYRLGDRADNPQHENTFAAIEAAESGVHGQELWKFLDKQLKNNDDNNPPDVTESDDDRPEA